MLREINELFVQVMEGKTARGQESFSEALLSIYKHIFYYEENRKICEFYISISFGDNNYQRSVPYVLAKQYNFFPKECALLEYEREKDYQRRMEEYEALSYEAAEAIGFKKPNYNPYKNLVPRVLRPYEIFWLTIGVREILDEYTKDSLSKLVRTCELLAKPENHILVKSGQLMEKQAYTCTAADMKAEMAQELANLPRYVAWTKITSTSGKVIKSKIKTNTVEEEFLPCEEHEEHMQKIIKNTREIYYTRRDLIEEEIIKRQARWRGNMQSPSDEEAIDRKVTGSSDKSPPPNRLASEQVSEEKERDGSGKSKPPPSSIPSQTASAAQEPEEKNLIYRSNFYLPDSNWFEGEAYGEYFRRDGYYHIRVRNFGFGHQELKFILADFRLYFDAEFITGTDQTDSYGIQFRRDTNDSYYAFSILRFGFYTLGIYSNKTWRTIIGLPFPDLIRGGNNSPNSLMVEMVGQKITLGVNGQILRTVIDSTLKSGYFGLYVSTSKNDSVKEFRFRNFRLYSLE